MILINVCILTNEGPWLVIKNVQDFDFFNWFVNWLLLLFTDGFIEMLILFHIVTKLWGGVMYLSLE